MRTSDGIEITHDLRVWTNDFRPGSVVIDDRHRPYQEAGEWWFSVLEDGADRLTLSSNHGSRRATPARRVAHVPAARGGT